MGTVPHRRDGEQGPHPKASGVSTLGCFLGGLLMVAVMLAATGWFVWSCGRKVTGPPDLAEITYRSGVVFPPGTRIVNAYAHRWLTTILLVRLELPRSEVDGLVASLPASWKRSAKERLGITDTMLKPPPAWWNPQSPARFLAFVGREGEGDIGSALHLLFALDDPQQTTLYLYQWWD